MPVGALTYLTLAVVVSWDLYFFLSYVLKLLKAKIPQRDDEWMPAVSVLIPAYNEENNVKSAIESVLSNGYENLEVIVIDDGSSDGTFRAASEMSGMGPVRVVRIEHGGKAKALNAGLSLARGEIVVTMDADCTLRRGAIESLVRRFHSKDVAAVGGQVRVVVDSFLSLMQDAEHLRIAMFRRARELENLSLAPGPLSAFKKKALLDVGGFSQNLVEDYATSMKLKEIGRIVYAPGAVVWTKMHSSLRRLWKQRVRWAIGNLTNLGSEPLGRKIGVVIGDVVTFMDVALPFVLFACSRPLLILWAGFEIMSMALPAKIEGVPPARGWAEVLLFPAILWLWAVFYASLHTYCYFRFYVLGKRDTGWS
ncbi:MAG: glycosyltransferase family 2 protein [Thermococci archaeon]|nr:glycosyltransferase family 2 protein [Thermococci archaeon]